MQYILIIFLPPPTLPRCSSPAHLPKVLTASGSEITNPKNNPFWQGVSSTSLGEWEHDAIQFSEIKPVGKAAKTCLSRNKQSPRINMITLIKL